MSLLLRRQAPAAIPDQPLVRYPDYIPRVQNRAHQQYVFQTLQDQQRMDWQQRVPDRVERPKTQQQQAFAMGPSPIAEVTYVTALYPDGSPRRAPQQPQAFTTSPQPEQTAAQALAVFPAAIDRPRRTPGWFALDPKPEEKIQLDWQPRYPDRLPRLFAQHTAFFFSPQPEQTTAQAALSIFPAAIDRPRRTPGWFALDPKPEQAVPSAYVSYPDRIDRRDVRVVDHVAHTFDPQPEAPIAYFNDIYPDRIDRPKVLPSQQPYFTTSPEPERTESLADAIYPSRIDRARWVDGYFALWPIPIPTPPPPPPSPLPTPERLPVRLDERPIPFGGDFVGWRIVKPIPREWAEDLVVTRPNPKREDADYALLPLGPEVVVRALADGLLEVFDDGKVVRLTADDGTTYFYAKVTKVKSGRVKKDDPIGVSTEAAIAPKALPPPSDARVKTLSTHEPEEPKGVFGVLPVAPSAPKTVLKPPPLPIRALQPRKQVIVRRAPPPSVSEALVMGAGIVGAAIVVAAIIRAVRRAPKKKKKKKKRSKSRRRR